MITVIADDITGAAEIAGVCLRYGLSVTLDFDISKVPNTDVWVIATNTRSLPLNEAIEETHWIGKVLKEKKITNIFKKIDSVLRGYIVPEIKTLLEYVPKKRVFILPANPEMGRIINHGRYYINGHILSETSFAKDPDFPSKFSSVDKILDTAPEDSSLFVTPDIMYVRDYETYATQINENILPAGGSVFFEIFLTTCYPQLCKGSKNVNGIPGPKSNLLMICGSTHENSVRFVEKARNSFSVFELPVTLIDEGNKDSYLMQQWVNDMVDAINNKERVIITTNRKEIRPEASDTIRELITEATKRIMLRTTINELYIEGGGTTYSIIKELGFSSFIPVKEYTRGVVRMRVPSKEDFYLSIKPGSYEWPEKLFS